MVVKKIHKMFRSWGGILAGGILVVIGVGGLMQATSWDIGSIWVSAGLALIGALTMWASLGKK